jgi:lipid A 3-O-deacylase
MYMRPLARVLPAALALFPVLALAEEDRMVNIPVTQKYTERYLDTRPSEKRPENYKSLVKPSVEPDSPPAVAPDSNYYTQRSQYYYGSDNKSPAAVGRRYHYAPTQEKPRPETEDSRPIFTMALENDLFSGKDNSYTNGVRLSLVSSESGVPDWMREAASTLPFVAANSYKRWSFEVGQNMYTPSDTTRDPPDPKDRPYAGWLYASAGITSDTGKTLDNYQLTLGVVGPGSLAGDTQRFVHNVIGADDPKGWGAQLHDEPGFIFSYERSWRGLYEMSPSGFGIDLTPRATVNLGNVYTHGALSAVLRIGEDLPSDYGPPLIHPGSTGSDFFVPNGTFGWYIFGGAEGRAVARNIFLDGNTFEDSPSVDKFPFIYGLQAGIAFTFGDTRLAYTQVFRSTEFKNQPEADSYGAVTMSVRF